MIRPILAAVVCGLALAGAGSADEDATEKKLREAKAQYEKDAGAARGRVAAELRKMADAAQKAGDLKKLEKAQAETKAFEDTGTPPKALAAVYESDLRQARAKLLNAYTTAVKEYTKAGKVDQAQAAQADVDLLKNGKPVEFTPLFNGKDLRGWKATQDAHLWVVEDGVIVCKGASKKTDGGWLLTEREYENFALRCEYRWLDKAGNSGIALRTPFKGAPHLDGIEIQLIDDKGFPRPLADVEHTGSIYGVHAARQVAGMHKKIGDWNAVHILCNVRTVAVVYNGFDILKANLDVHRAQFGTHPGLKRVKGRIGFQAHTSRIEFRNIAIKEL